MKSCIQGTIACALVLAIASCDNTPVQPTVRPTASIGYPRTIVDSFDVAVTLHARPTRIVSTAPSNTEILFAIGAGPQVIGTTTYCTFPEEAAKVKKIGGFAPKTISIEHIVALQPDLVLTTGRIQESLTESLRKLGLNVLSYDSHRLEDVLANIRRIGQATDQVEAAENLALRLEDRLAAVRLSTAKIGKRPGVLFLLSEAPLMTAGAGSFAGQMIEWAGGRNIFGDLDQQFPRVSEEAILERNPDVIVLWKNDDLTSRKQRLANRPGWKALAALQNDRILAIEDDLLSRPGPRLFDGLEQLTELLHPRRP